MNSNHNRIATSNDVLKPAEIRDDIEFITRKLNINKWDLGASSSRDNSVQVFNGEAKQLKSSQRSSITVRVWNNKNLVGITSTSDFSQNGLSEALKTACEASFYGNKEETPEFSLLSLADIETTKPLLRKTSTIKLLFERLLQAESELLAKHKSINSVPYNGFSELDYERLYLNSLGSLRFHRNTQSSLYLYAKAQESHRKPRSGGSIKIGYGYEDINVEECIEEAANRTLSHLNYEPINTGKYLVCFSPEAFLDLMYAFSNIFNARSVLDGISLSSSKTLGSQIASSLLKVSDDSLHPANVGAIRFDGEGTPTKETVIIDNGKLISFIHSESTARRFGVNPTGHAGLGAKVSVSPEWLVVSRNNNSNSAQEDLNHLTTKSEFVLIENLNALHAGIKASQGSFSLPFDGWLVKNGERISVESATIAGDIRYLLNNIVQIESDSLDTHSGVSPHVWVNGLSVTGEK